MRGIKLDFDSDGNAKVIQPESGELCSGIVICVNCKAGICQIQQESWWNMSECPSKKWIHYKYYCMGTLATFKKEGCPVCGSQDFWGKNKICNICHPQIKNEKGI